MALKPYYKSDLMAFLPNRYNYSLFTFLFIATACGDDAPGNIPMVSESSGTIAATETQDVTTTISTPESDSTTKDILSGSHSDSESYGTSSAGDASSSDSSGVVTSSSTSEEPFCGNGIVEMDEECDDGNADDQDECRNTCKLTFCGDGIITFGVGEECDFGPGNSNSNSCTSECKNAVCGDGFVFAGVEECDDGDQNDWNFCTSECKNAVCGDGIKQWVTGEECDLGSENSDDGACTKECKLADCGDGIISFEAGEECDGPVPFGTCSNSCKYTREPTVFAGSRHVCALSRDGRVRCWGYNERGQLGIGINTLIVGDNELPKTLVKEVDVGGTVTQLALGDEHTCALLTDGNVRCWGDYRMTGNPEVVAAQLFIGDDEPVSELAQNVTLGGKATKISAYSHHTCALMESGGIRCWGLNSNGCFGIPGVLSIDDPSAVGDVPTGASLNNPIVDLAVSSHICAVFANKKIRCWGLNSDGQLGYGHTNDIGDNEPPASVGYVPVGGDVKSVAVGAYHTCALLTSGKLRCWGWASNGQLGYGWTPNIGDDETPASKGDVPFPKTVKTLALGFSHTCALTTELGQVYCWGSGNYGVRGTGTGGSVLTAADAQKALIVEGGWFLSTVKDISANSRANYAMISSNNLWPRIRAWGYNDNEFVYFSSILGYGDIDPNDPDHPDHVGDEADDVPMIKGDVLYY